MFKKTAPTINKWSEPVTWAACPYGELHRHDGLNMKVFTKFVVALPSPGTEIVTDSLCSTSVWHRGVWYGGAEETFILPKWEEGDEFRLDTRHGTISGTLEKVKVYSADDSAEARQRAAVFGGPQPSETGIRLHVKGEFDGGEGCLLGGLHAFGGFTAEISSGTTIYSSVAPGGMSYGRYTALKEKARATAPYTLRGEELRQAMKQLIARQLVAQKRRTRLNPTPRNTGRLEKYCQTLTA